MKVLEFVVNGTGNSRATAQIQCQNTRFTGIAFIAPKATNAATTCYIDFGEGPIPFRSGQCMTFGEKRLEELESDFNQSKFKWKRGAVTCFMDGHDGADTSAAYVILLHDGEAFTR